MVLAVLHGYLSLPKEYESFGFLGFEVGDVCCLKHVADSFHFSSLFIWIQ